MGMFDRTRNFGEVFKPGDRFVITGARYDGEIGTVHGVAQKSTLTVVTRESYPQSEDFSALGVGFARQARQAERGDFPVVVEYVSVPTGSGDRTVKLFAPVAMDCKAWVEGEDGPPAELEDALAPAKDSATTPAGAGF